MRASMKAATTASPSPRLLVVGAVALMIGLIAAIWLQKPAPAPIVSGTLLPAPRPLADFQALDQDGAPFTTAQLRGHWTLIFPGFTFCPDICPTTLAMLKSVAAGLDEPTRAQLRIAFLSVDPQRDTPAKLKAYVQYFDPTFLAFTAPEPQLKSLAQMLGVAYVRVPGASPDAYTMDHSAALILIDPQARIAGYLTPPFDATRVGADLHRIVAGS